MVPLILYSLLSFLTLKGESLYSTRVDIDWSGRYITYLKVRDGVFLGMEVVPLEEYIDHSMRNAIQSMWSSTVKEEMAGGQKVGEGLIPTIYIPIKFPTPVAGLIGEGGALKISGNERIEFGGSNTQEVDPVYTETYQRSLLPQLEMEQQLRVNLEGTIGQKIHVFIDHDSKREFDIKNTIRLQYKGDEDEVIKEINAGNTDISLYGGIIGAPTAHKGLFGIKMLAGIGPFDITAIASKEESEVEQKNFIGGAIEDSAKLYDTDFIKNKFFSLRHVTLGNGAVVEVDSIIDIKLYRSADQTEGDNYWIYWGEAIDYNIEAGEPDTVGGFFKLLEQGDKEDFVLNRSDKIIDLRGYFDSRVIGFVLVYKTTGGTVDTIGDNTSDPDSVLLGMLKRRKNDKDPCYASWEYELKNIYALPVGNITPESFEMKIFKEKAEGEDEEFVSGDTTFLQYFDMAKADGTIDRKFVDFNLGMVIFPYEKPFIELPDPDSIYQIRNLTPDIGRKYYIWMKYKGIQKRYSLGLNVLEGSEKVTMDGRLLKRGVDYDVNYDFGELTFREGVIRDPNARIVIDYQHLPFMQTASKNLLGARVNYDRGGNLKFGSTFIYHSSSSFDKRPKLGSEPTKIVLGEIDGNYSAVPSLFTHLVNLVPFVKTDAPSSFNLSFKMGFSAPNPNTRGKVYIDDMEGTRTSTSLGIGRTNWVYGSKPLGMGLNDFEPLRWYNPRDGIRRGDIYPSLPDYRKNEKQSILRIECKGEWGSLLSLVSRDGADFEKSEFLELWARGDGTIHVDIGSNIPEEELYKDKWGEIKRNESDIPRTEDANHNGKLDIGLGEDTGLDGVMGKDEDNVTGDDGNDDYHYSVDDPDNYSRINGTEENGRFDTEDLDTDGSLNKKTDYFSFRMDLSSDEHLVQEGENGWRLYRLPLQEAEETGSPRWSFVRYARLWLEGPDTVDIATIEVVGNRWEKRGEIELSFRDNQENTGVPPYDPPYEPERDPYGREEKESSLSMIFHNGEEGSAYTVYGSEKKFIQYNTLSLYLKGVNLTGEGKFFIRVGVDTLKYYEYRVSIPEDWRDIRIPLDSLTHLKRERDTLPQDSLFGHGLSGGDSCFVLRNPSLTNIKMVEIGVIPDEGVDGEVWVDDIRLLDVEKNTGLAASVNSTLKFADLMNVTLTYSRRDPYFRKFTDKLYPEGGLSNSYKTTFSLGLGKFLPSSWGISVPVHGGMSKTTVLPMYPTNSDIVLSDEESEKEKTVTKPRNITIGFSKTGSENKFLAYTLDNITADASYRETFSYRPTGIDSVKNINLSTGYGCSPELGELKLFGMGVKYYPDNFRISSNYSRSETRRYKVSRDSIVLVENPNPIVRTDRASISYSPVNAITSSYSILSSNDINFSREVSRSENLALNFSPNIWDFTTQKFSYTSKYTENNSIEKVEVVDGDTLPVRDATNINAVDIDLGINLQKIGNKVGFLRGFTKLFTNPTLSYSLSRSAGMYSLLARAKRDFIFGFSPDAGVDKINSAKDSEKSTGDISISSGFKWSIVNFSLAYREGESWGGTIDNKRWSKNRTYPDIRFGLSSLEKFWRFKKLLSSLSLSANLKVCETYEGYAIDEPSGETRNISLTPSLNLRWKSGISSRISSSVSSKYTKTHTGGNAFFEKEDRHFEIGASNSYTFSAPTGMKLPFLSNVKFAGNLNTNLDIKYTFDEGENITRDSKSKDRYRLTITPGMSYNFASNITGGAKIDFREDNDRMTRMHTRTVGMSVWADFRF
ncbi:hypothetical protein CH333_06020 [candidate division WOR-3 bacterium JGI_Cruoil_03_44_89]|uniref:Gliding motility protein SprA N-terminal domain-containing protein n=1 Tax=candidate division WOR-3 bacterium JGI_Cruoil_03_44_89 TaxID=1973748 RepID=A0A235BSY4_UNCW3|nr:MAG: hypothetical protein CH333_06020 [candidate division WOR-3 bacterium JGI_Cruoil_03_44_89]